MNKKIFAIIIFASLLFPAIAAAQSTGASSLTITPPFFELNVSPGDSWSSSIRVVNTNPGDLTVHAIVMGFGAADDQGHGAFTPLAELSGDTDALANWITAPSSSIDVPSGQATDVPFSVNVPMNASPGGHYAAILIGTGAPSPQPGVSQVGVSSYISALIFVNVSGNVVESANIQEFSTDRSYYETPDVHFTLLVQNNGNTHVRPVGTIQIYNMFGKERGEISINATGTLGYVLPSSSREFDEEWQNPPSLLDIGPYTAVVSIAYGENGTKSVSETIEFWILPIYQILEVLLGAIIVAGLFVFIVRRSIRKMLASEMTKYGGVPPHHPAAHAERGKKKQGSDTDVLDLRKKNDE